MGKGTRYFLEGDDVGITPSQLKKAGGARQREYMLAWFRTYYEDPVRETPISEGEYVYPWGGPYDAVDELHHEFGSFIPEERVSDLAVELQRKGTTDWAPTGRHPDHQRAMLRDSDETTEDEPDTTGAGPDFDELDAADRVNSFAQAELKVLNTAEFRFGSAEERAAREALQNEVAALRREVASLRAAPAGIGHNHPPPDDVEDEEDLEEPTPKATEAIAVVISNELAMPEPDVEKVVKAAGRLSRIKDFFIGKAKAGADKGIEKGFENLFAWMPLAFATTAFTAFLGYFWAIETALFHWIDVLTGLGKGFW